MVAKYGSLLYTKAGMGNLLPFAITLGCICPSTLFPYLFAFSLSMEAVSDLWKEDEGCWDLNLHRNLTEVEICEWAAQSHLLSNHQPQQSDDKWIIYLLFSNDKWIWKLESTNIFPTKSLSENRNKICSQSIMGPFITISSDHLSKKD